MFGCFVLMQRGRCGTVFVVISCSRTCFLDFYLLPPPPLSLYVCPYCVFDPTSFRFSASCLIGIIPPFRFCFAYFFLNLRTNLSLANTLMHALSLLFPYRTITYILLCGYSPFRSDKVEAWTEETKKGEVIFHEKYWGTVSVVGEY